MSQPSFDFGPEPADDEEPLDDAANPTLTVGELADEINRALRRSFFDGVWVRGEIHDLSERNGHLYLTLADDAPGRKAVLRVQFFANARVRLRPLLTKHRLRLSVGMKVRVYGHLDYYGPGGSIGLKMTDLDPRYTLGDLAQQRDQIVRRLVADGAIDANKRRPAQRGATADRRGVQRGHGGVARLPRGAAQQRTRLPGRAGQHRRAGPHRVSGRHPSHPRTLPSRRRAWPRRHRRHPRRRGPQRTRRLRRRTDRPRHRGCARARAHRARPRGRPQRGRRVRPHVLQDTDRVRGGAGAGRRHVPRRGRAVLRRHRQPGRRARWCQPRTASPIGPGESVIAPTPRSSGPTSG